MKKCFGFILTLLLLAPALSRSAQVVIGQVGPMSGLEANQGRAYAAGMQLLFDSVNKTGGVAGHTFTLVRKDDGGRPSDTIAATREMLEREKPLVLAGYFGSRNINELVRSGFLERNRIALVGYRTSEISLDSALVYSVRAGLREEINKVAEHLRTIGITHLGLFYEEGPGSAAVIAAAEEATLGKVLAKASYPVGTSRVSNAVNAFLKSSPQAILMVSSGAAAAAFIERYRSDGGAAQLFAHSGADIEQLSKRLSAEQMTGVAIAQVTPSPYKVSGMLAKEFADLVAKKPPEVPVSYVMMEGFIAAKVIAEAVRRQGGRPTREGVISALDNMDKLDLGGYVVGFKNGVRTGSKFVELTIVSAAGRIRQ